MKNRMGSWDYYIEYPDKTRRTVYKTIEGDCYIESFWNLNLIKVDKNMVKAKGI